MNWCIGNLKVMHLTNLRFPDKDNVLHAKIWKSCNKKDNLSPCIPLEQNAWKHDPLVSPQGAVQCEDVIIRHWMLHKKGYSTDHYTNRGGRNPLTWLFYYFILNVSPVFIRKNNDRFLLPDPVIPLGTVTWKFHMPKQYTAVTIIILLIVIRLVMNEVKGESTWRQLA